jgi:hypothetical protein
MTQFSRPNSDVSRGAWTDEGGGTTNIFTHINEVTPNDTNFVQDDSIGGQDSSYRFGMSTVTDPTINTGHIIKWRFKRALSNTDLVDVTFNLFSNNGNFLVKARTFTSISTTVTEDDYTLTTTEAATIRANGGYATLQGQVNAHFHGSSLENIAEVTWVEFDVPNAVVTTPLTRLLLGAGL